MLILSVIWRKVNLKSEKHTVNESVVSLKLTELYPFPNHPYGIREDASMQETLDSVKQSGVIGPAIVRPRAEGGYEIVSGHRRKAAKICYNIRHAAVLRVSKVTFYNSNE